jgi:hypothetical protein
MLSRITTRVGQMSARVRMFLTSQFWCFSRKGGGSQPHPLARIVPPASVCSTDNSPLCSSNARLYRSSSLLPFQAPGLKKCLTPMTARRMKPLAPRHRSRPRSEQMLVPDRCAEVPQEYAAETAPAAFSKSCRATSYSTMLLSRIMRGQTGSFASGLD